MHTYLARELDAFYVLGLEARTSFLGESRVESQKIPQLWQRFARENIVEQLRLHRSDDLVYAVYSNYESDQHGDYSLVVGCRLGSVLPGSTQLASVEVGEGVYRVFVAEGAMPEALIETWSVIWNYFSTSLDKRVFKTDFEIHDPSQPNRVLVCVSVNRSLADD